MSDSYKETIKEYKDNKKRLVDGYEDTPHKKSSKKTGKKRSDHKHMYIPAVYHFYYIDFQGKEHLQTSFGFHCYICGRIKDFYYTWSANPNQLENFKLEYPYYAEITLPKDWDIRKNIPV